MALKDDIAVLSRVPVFSGMSEEQIRLLAFGAEKRHLSEGQVLFKQGQAANCAYAVLSGQIELTSSNGRGGQTALPGTLLSELAMISNVERKFTATALENTEVIRISRELFLRLLEEFPEAASIVEDRIRENLNALLGGLAAQARRFS